MTVAYKGRHRLLYRFSGTVLPQVWKMCFLTMFLALGLCFVYNPIRRAVARGDKKTLLCALARHTGCEPRAASEHT